MSVDVTPPDAMPARVRPRFRGGSAPPSPKIPTLLRVPDVRSQSPVAPGPIGAATAEPFFTTISHETEATAAQFDQVGTEPEGVAGDVKPDHELARRLPEVGLRRDTFSRAFVKARTIKGLRWFAQKWAGHARTVGAIALAVTVCALVVWAVQPDDLEPAPGPPQVTQSEEKALGGSRDRQESEIASRDAPADADRVASEQAIAEGALDKASISRMPESPENTLDAGSFYASSPAAGGSESTQPSRLPSRSIYAGQNSTPPSHRPQSNDASNPDRPPSDQQRWSSMPSARYPQTSFAENERPQGSQATGSQATGAASPTPPLGPSPDRGNPNPSTLQSFMPPALPSANRLPGSPQSLQSYPATDTSRYGSFHDLKTALQQRKLERGQPWRTEESRRSTPTGSPDGGPAASGTIPSFTHGGAYH